MTPGVVCKVYEPLGRNISDRLPTHIAGILDKSGGDKRYSWKSERMKNGCGIRTEIIIAVIKRQEYRSTWKCRTAVKKCNQLFDPDRYIPAVFEVLHLFLKQSRVNGEACMTLLFCCIKILDMMIQEGRNYGTGAVQRTQFSECKRSRCRSWGGC